MGPDDISILKLLLLNPETFSAIIWSIDSCLNGRTARSAPHVRYDRAEELQYTGLAGKLRHIL